MTILTIFHIILSITLTFLIFLQSKGESSGNSNLMSPPKNQKRGFEKVVFQLTFIILLAFITTSILQNL